MKVEKLSAQTEKVEKTKSLDEKEEKSEVISEPEVEHKASPSTKSSGKKEIVEFRFPDLGENIESADVLNVLVKKGDIIQFDQAILEIETDKATIEVPSSVAGKVVEVLIKPGSKAKVGDVMIKVESGDVPVEESKPTEVKDRTVKNPNKLKQKKKKC